MSATGQPAPYAKSVVLCIALFGAMYVASSVAWQCMVVLMLRPLYRQWNTGLSHD